MAILRSPDSMTGPGPRVKWTTARIISAVVGLLLALCSLGLLGGGGVALWASGSCGQPLPGRGRLRHRPRHQPSPACLHRARWRRSRDRACPGRHLGRSCGWVWHPDPDLAGPRRQLDGGRHERRRVTSGRRAHHRRRVAAVPALDRSWVAGRRDPCAGRRRGPQHRSRRTRSQPPRPKLDNRRADTRTADPVATPLVVDL